MRLKLSNVLYISVLVYALYKMFDYNSAYITYFSRQYNTLIIYTIVFNILVYKYVIKRMVFEQHYQESIQKSDVHVRKYYNVGVMGHIGKKKTCNSVAIVQMVEKVMIKEIEEQLYKIKLHFKDLIDFEEFNAFIHVNYQKDKAYCDWDYTYIAIRYMQHLGHDLFTLRYWNYRFNSFSEERTIDILAWYVELIYIHAIRDNYILSTTTIHSINTTKNSIPIEEALTQFYRQPIMATEKYTIQVFDEGTILDNSRVNAAMDKKSREENDDGKDIEGAIQRHLGKGTNLRLTIGQELDDITANRRRMYNRIVELHKPQELYLYQFEISVLSWLQRFLRKHELKRQRRKLRKSKRNRFYHFITRRKYFKKKSEKLFMKFYNYSDRRNNYKKFILLLDKLLIKLKYYLYLVQYMYLHNTYKSYGKEIFNENGELRIKSSIPMYIVYPAGITYGQYDQYSFYGFANLRNKRAKKSLSDIEPFVKKIMIDRDFRRMKFKGIEKIYTHIEQPEAVSGTKKTKKEVKPSIKEPLKIHLDAFED